MTQPDERRLSQRISALRGTLPGKLMLPSTHEYLRARATDVSKAGMSVLLDRALKEGMSVWLVLEGRYLKFEVASCGPAKKEKNLFRCGLSLCESHENLVELFHGAGCMVTTYAGNRFKTQE